MLLNSMGVVLSSLATTIPDVQKVFEGLLASYPVKLYPLPTTSVDKGPRKSILDVEHVGILPKPPWSLLCLEHGNSKAWSSGWHQFSKTFSLQHTLEGRHAISPHGSLDQFHKSFVSQHCLEELLLNGVHCSMKLMESLLIGKIATYVSDSMATCLWRILLALIWQHRNESSSSLVSNQIMHFAILYAKLMNEGAKDFQLDACFWRGLTCYSDSIVKFASSGYLQINDLDQRNDIDKNKWVLDLDLYCFVFAYGVLQMWLKFSLYLAWLTYSSENVAVHSNDQIARALLNKREVWLKHSNSGCPMFQSASSEVFTSVLLTKHLVLQFGVSVWCLFSQATPTRSC